LVAIQNLYWALGHQHHAVVLGLVGIFTSGNGLDAKIGMVGIRDQSWEIPELRWDLGKIARFKLFDYLPRMV